MFTYLRYFSAISFILVVMAAIAVGIYFRQTAANDLKMVVEQNNISLSQGFTNTVWRRYNRLFTEILKDAPVREWPQDKRFLQFSKEAFRYFESIPVAKLNIYTASGERFLSTNQAEIMLFQSEGGLLFGKKGQGTEAEAMESVRQGKVFSRIVPDGGFKGADGSLHHGSLIQTFIPILADSYVPAVVDNSAPKIEGFIEVFYDISSQYRQLDQFQIVGTSGIIIIFLLLFAALIFTAKKAESIISKQHEKTLELTAAKARAEAENLEKSRFLANISHELRTPLNAIIGFSEIIKTQALGPVGNTQYVEYVADIHSSGVHLLSLINDILDYSKAEAGKLELEISEMDVTKLVRTCMRLVQTRAEEAKVNLVENVPKEHFILTTDAKKLKQVLLNLLSNAVKFTPVGGSVTVSAWQNLSDETYTIEVKDTGIGIAPKDISKAMSPFGQVDSELSRKYEGTGLGLPLTKKFTEIMGGVFNIHSELNVGTTITVTLPKFPPESAIKKGPSMKKQPDAAATAAASSEVDLSSATAAPVKAVATVAPVAPAPVATPQPQPQPAVAPVPPPVVAAPVQAPPAAPLAVPPSHQSAPPLPRFAPMPAPTPPVAPPSPFAPTPPASAAAPAASPVAPQGFVGNPVAKAPAVAEPAVAPAVVMPSPVPVAPPPMAPAPVQVTPVAPPSPPVASAPMAPPPQPPVQANPFMPPQPTQDSTSGGASGSAATSGGGGLSLAVPGAEMQTSVAPTNPFAPPSTGQNS